MSSSKEAAAAPGGTEKPYPALCPEASVPLE
jgi:hypothetical protein